MSVNRYWRLPEYLECGNCNRRYSSVGLRTRDYETPSPCSMCGFDVYPVWGDRDHDAVRESHTGWGQPESFMCDNCGTSYSAVGMHSDQYFKCSRCYALVYPRH